MRREEKIEIAIEIIENNSSLINLPKYDKIVSIFKPERLVKWLKDYKQMLEREPCEDAISRAEAIRVASGYCHPANIAKELEKLPPVQPEQKTGHWEPKIDFDDTRYGYICNRCKNWVRDKSDYCPNCGAKMVESEE